jgi:predicted kinase
MSTIKELEKQLREAKKKNREKDKIIEEHKIREKVYWERLEKAHERLQDKNKVIMNMTFDDVAKMQKEKAAYAEKYLKDKELVEAFENQVKQSEKLNAL